MRKVNEAFLHDILSPLAGLADCDEEVEKYASINPNNIYEMHLIIKENILPFVLSQPVAYQQAVKSALSFYLTKGNLDWGRLFNSNLLPFKHPTEAKQFFIWIWQLLYGDEAYVLSNLEEFCEVKDFNEPIHLSSKKSGE